jgi:thiamine biosynthesis lipoprotein
MILLATRAMGTRFEIVLAGAESAALRAAGEAAIECIEEWDRRLSLFRSDSLVAYVNRNAHAGAVRLDADCFELFSECERVHALSGGAFDVGVGARMAALGLQQRHSRGDVEAGARDIELDGERSTIRFRRPKVEIDLGAVGKGHALDRAADCLRGAGVTSALLHGGTSCVVAIGAAPDWRRGKGWTIAVEGGSGAPTARLVDCALCVSAQHPRRAHVLDPRSGRSAPADAACAVTAPSARTADAWSTALLAGSGWPSEIEGLAAIRGSGARAGRCWRRLGGSARSFHIPSPSSEPIPTPSR